ncbi:MAG: hypothetical protein ACJA2S_005565 [Cyclobacteriaceae bacterium]|jgi:hypothetical protein
MKTKIEWELAIVKITDTINQKFPELSKYMVEIPVKGSGKDEVNIKNLEDYYNSLEELLNEYTKTHKSD